MQIFNFYRVKNLLILLLAGVLAACATNKSKQDVVIDTDDIAIYEEYGIDTDLTEKFNQAVSLIKAKKFKDAIDLLLVVTSKTNKHSAPYINLAIAYSETGNVEEAEKILLKALKINPNHPVTNNEIGMLYRKTGRFADAKQAYENVIKRYPQFLPVRKNLGILCDLFMGDLDCAIEHYEAYLKLNPEEKKVQIWLADLKRRAGQ